MADPQPGDKLTPAQHRAISELLLQPGVRKAAEVANVKERTLYAWLKNDDFQAAYREARREATQQAIARLQSASSAAVSVLCQLMANGTPSVKLGAARTILEMAIETLKIEDLAARVAALEGKDVASVS
jgi:hypothetical protein